MPRRRYNVAGHKFEPRKKGYDDAEGLGDYGETNEAKIANKAACDEFLVRLIRHHGAKHEDDT